MATIRKPVVMVFEKDQAANFKEVLHFNLIEGERLLSQKLNLSINRKFSRAKYTYCLKIRKAGKWSKQITGLFPTHDPELYYGDINEKTNLVLFRFLDNGNKLKVYYFKKFYARRIRDFLKTFMELF